MLLKTFSHQIRSWKYNIKSAYNKKLLKIRLVCTPFHLWNIYLGALCKNVFLDFCKNGVFILQYCISFEHYFLIRMKLLTPCVSVGLRTPWQLAMLLAHCWILKRQETHFWMPDIAFDLIACLVCTYKLIANKFCSII